MQQYLLSIYQPDGPPPEDLDLEAVMARVNAMVQESKDAGAWVFNAGLHPPSTATVLHAKFDDVLMTDGPYLEGKEHIGGFMIVQAADIDEALVWGRKLATALAGLSIEVRPLVEEH